MKRRDAIKRAAWMGGIALSAPSMLAALQGCSADRSLDWTPQFLSNDEARLVADMAETILPLTEGSPGAKDVQVDRFVDDMLANYSDEEMQGGFRSGLEKFNEACKAANGAPFTELDAKAQHDYLSEINQKAISGNENDTAFPQFLAFKQAVFTGYFTSEEVGEQVLAYESVPGSWEACVPLDGPSGGKTWSL